MTTIHIDARTPDVDKLIQSLAAMVRGAPPDASVTLDRDTLRAVIGAYKIATAALDDLGEAVRDYRARAAEAADGFELIDEVLADHGIELADFTGDPSDTTGRKPVTPTENDARTEAERDARDPAAVAEAVRYLRAHVDGDDTVLIGRWSLGVLLADYDRRGERIVNLEAGREVEQDMVRNAALRVEDAERHLALVTTEHDRLRVQRDAVLAIHQAVSGLFPPSCQACREHEDFTMWPCDTAAALGVTLGGAP